MFNCRKNTDCKKENILAAPREKGSSNFPRINQIAHTRSLSKATCLTLSLKFPLDLLLT